MVNPEKIGHPDPSSISDHSLDPIPHTLLLQKMFDSSIDLVLFFKAVRDEQDNVIDFKGIFNNKASQVYLGDIRNKSLSTDQPLLNNWQFDKAKQVVHTGTPYIIEQFHQFPGYDGWFHHVITMVDDGIMITSRDITSLKNDAVSKQQSQDFLQAVLDHSLDVIQVFDAVRDETGRIIDFRWKVQNSKGYLQNGDVIGKSLLGQNAGVISSGIFDRMIKVTETGVPDEQEQFYSHEQFEDQWFYQALVKQEDGVLMTTRNITVEKQAEQKILQLKDELIRLSENRYLTLFNSMDEGFCIIEMIFNENDEPYNWRYVEVNPAFEKHNGLHNAVGKTILELTPRIEQKWMDIYGSVAVTGKSIRFEEDSDAFARIFDLYAFRIGEPAERKVAVLFTNVTARRQAERALRRSEEKFRTLFSSIDDGFSILQLIYNDHDELSDFLYLETNPAFVKHVGLDLKGKRRSEAFSEKLDFLLQKYDHIAKTGEPLHFEYQMESLGNQWFQVAVSRIGQKESKLLGVVFRNITQQKNIEARQAFLLELNDAIGPIEDPDKIQRIALSMLSDHLHVPELSFRELSDDVLSGLTYIRQTGSFRNENILISRHQHEIKEFEKGKTRSCSDSKLEGLPALINNIPSNAAIAAYMIVPVLAARKCAGVITVISYQTREWAPEEITLVENVTERVWGLIQRARAEKSLRDREHQLEELLRMREDFISIASHELRTPVTSIQILADLIEEQVKTEGGSAVGMVNKLNAQLVRLTKLINDLLDTSKIQDGRIAYDMESTEINSLIAEQVEELQRTTSHHIILELDKPVYLSIDRNRFVQVLTNLVANAIKYSPRSKPIYVRTIVSAENISITVADEGIGIPESSLPFIFDRFYRATSGQMSNYTGMGLGLYITAEIVKNHGGQLSVNSVEGMGSEFTCTIPLLQPVSGTR